MASPDLVRHAGFVLWRLGAHLHGAATCGRVTAADVVVLGGLLARAAEVGSACVIDARRSLAFDGAVLLAWAAALGEVAARHAAAGCRQAFLLPPGAAGTVLAGANFMHGARHEWRTFGDLEAALAWSGAGDPPSLAGELDRCARGWDGLPREVREVRLALEARPTASLDLVARALTTTRRALQRALAAAGTTFAAEVSLTRIARARALLADPALKLEAVAHACGFASHTRFSLAYRRATGEQPSAARRRLLAS